MITTSHDKASSSLAGSTRLEQTFRSLKEGGKTALLGFIVAGDPTPEITPELMMTLFSSGVDILEIGIPFSDPAAEGIAIRKAHQRAMTHQLTVDDVLLMVTKVRRTTEKPIVLLSYFNPVHHYGLEAFIRACISAGVDGLIVPDLPFEEAHELRQLTQDKPLSLVTLVSPLTGPRLETLVQQAEGFLYCISSLGTTGAREELTIDTAQYSEIARLRPDLPRAIGFGVSTPDQVRMLKSYAEGVIVGSALIERVAQKSSHDACRTASEFINALRTALDV